MKNHLKVYLHSLYSKFHNSRWFQIFSSGTTPQLSRKTYKLGILLDICTHLEINSYDAIDFVRHPLVVLLLEYFKFKFNMRYEGKKRKYQLSSKYSILFPFFSETSKKKQFIRSLNEKRRSAIRKKNQSQTKIYAKISPMRQIMFYFQFFYFDAIFAVCCCIHKKETGSQ